MTAVSAPNGNQSLPASPTDAPAGKGMSTLSVEGPAAALQVPTAQADGSVKWGAGGATGLLDVTDGITSVTPTTEIDFTSGATVTNGGGGVAQVAISGGGSGPISSTTVTLTAAQVKNLATTTIDLVAAPGAGKLIVPVQFVIQLKNVGTPYDATGAHVEIALDPAGLEAIFVVNEWFGGFLPQAADSVGVPMVVGSTSYQYNLFETATPNAADKAISIWNWGADVTAGDGSLKIITYYVTTTL